MKRVRQSLVMLGALVLVPSFNLKAQTSSSSPHEERTVWISAPTGSLLGGGYTSSYLTNIRAKTIGGDAPALRGAIDSLDALGMVEVRNFGLVPAAVSWQTDVPIRELVVQQAETGLSYGELLLANSIAIESKQSLDHVVSMRAESRSWGQLMEQLQINPRPVIAKARLAADRIQHVEALASRRHAHALSLNKLSLH